MTELRNRLIHLHRCRHITRRRIHKILSIDPRLNEFFTYTKTQIGHALSIPANQANTLYEDLHNLTLQEQIKEDLNRYQVITIIDKNYPSMLKPIIDPPIVLYALGNTALLQDSPAFSVIGTRHPTALAMDKIKYFVEPLVQRQWVIVSGMAKGIDSLAHWMALTKGKTIAVLGGGFYHIYPKQNLSLFNEIKEKGLILSEYPPQVSPKPYHFPERNRIISGLSFGTLVIEAKEKSGTLITVDQALDQGREVYAIPDSPFTPQAKGCHKMIQDGAKLVTTAEDIIEDWERYGKNWEII